MLCCVSTDHSATAWKHSSISRGAMSEAACAGSVLGGSLSAISTTAAFARDLAALDHLVGRAVEEGLVDLVAVQGQGVKLRRGEVDGRRLRRVVAASGEHRRGSVPSRAWAGPAWPAR